MTDVTKEIDNLISLYGSERDALNITLSHLQAANSEIMYLKARVSSLEDEVVDLRDTYVPSGNQADD